MLFEYFFKIGNGERRELSKSAPPCILLKASILNSGIIFLCGVLIRLQHHLDLEHTLFLCDDKFIRMSVQWRSFVVRNGYAGDSNHPRELSMHTGRKPGKSWSWVDMSLSLVPGRDECVRYGMVRLDEW